MSGIKDTRHEEQTGGKLGGFVQDSQSDAGSSNDADAQSVQYKLSTCTMAYSHVLEQQLGPRCLYIALLHDQ